MFIIIILINSILYFYYQGQKYLNRDLSRKKAAVEKSFLAWDACGDYVPRLVHFCRTFMTNHFNFFRLKNQDILKQFFATQKFSKFGAEN